MHTAQRVLRQLLLILVLGLPTIGRLAASDLVWRVQSGTNRIYLAGSIHLLRTSDYPMPASFDAAFQAAHYLVLEADLDDASSPAFQQYVLSKAKYPVGSYLQSRISTQLYRYIMGYAAQQGLEPAAFDSYRPWFVNNYISVGKSIEQGLSSDLGVDQHYLALAKQKQKPRKFFETPQQQIDFLANSLESDWIKSLSAYAGLLPASQYPIQTGSQLIAKWRGGNIESFEENITVMARETPSVYDNLVRRRNQAWLPQIEAQLKSGEVAMVLVGALHFAGSDGLLNQLRTKGYPITQLPFTELPPTIASQPQAVAVTVGQAVQFSVIATGTAPLNYQWQRNAQNILGATSATYAIATAQLANAGDYRVVVSNGAGNITSQVAKLTVNAAVGELRIVQLRLLTTAEIEADLSFITTGDHVLETTSDFKSWTTARAFSATLPTMTVRVPNPTATSKFFRVRAVPVVPVGPVIVKQPVSQSAHVGGTVTFSVTANGQTPLRYQWYRNGVSLFEGTAASLVLSNLKLTVAGVYTVRVTDATGNVTSEPALLEVTL